MYKDLHFSAYASRFRICDGMFLVHIFSCISHLPRSFHFVLSILADDLALNLEVDEIATIMIIISATSRNKRRIARIAPKQL